MSSALLEERQEREAAARVAAAVGLTADEYEEAGGSIDEDSSDDGALYGYIVRFDEDAPPEILAKVRGLRDGCWVKTGPISFDDPSED